MALGHHTTQLLGTLSIPDSRLSFEMMYTAGLIVDKLQSAPFWVVARYSWDTPVLAESIPFFTSERLRSLIFTFLSYLLLCILRSVPYRCWVFTDFAARTSSMIQPFGVVGGASGFSGVAFRF